MGADWDYYTADSPVFLVAAPPTCSAGGKIVRSSFRVQRRPNRGRISFVLCERCASAPRERNERRRVRFTSVVRAFTRDPGKSLGGGHQKGGAYEGRAARRGCAASTFAGRFSTCRARMGKISPVLLAACNTYVLYHRRCGEAIFQGVTQKSSRLPFTRLRKAMDIEACARGRRGRD